MNDWVTNPLQSCLRGIIQQLRARPYYRSGRGTHGLATPTFCSSTHNVEIKITYQALASFISLTLHFMGVTIVKTIKLAFIYTYIIYKHDNNLHYIGLPMKNKENVMYKLLLVKLPERLHRELKTMAAKEGVTMSSICFRLLHEYVSKTEANSK